MMDMMAGMGALMLIALLVVAVVIGVAVYLAVRAGLRGARRDDDAQAVLQRRLSAGEITPEEYYERESVLSHGSPRGGRR